MKEFDQCPGCKEDLLLEAPNTDGKGLRCLGCGYTCQVSEPQAMSTNGVLSDQENEKIEYWKRRCNAAENVIESINTKDEGMYFIVHQAWLEIKEVGEPT